MLIQNIDSVPRESYHKEHYHCDYIEILALINNKDIISISDICDRYRKNKDIEETNNENAEDNIPIDDTWRSRIQEWLDNITVRNSVFNDFYPFTVGHDSIQLKDNLTNAHKIYIFLLLSSNQAYIPSGNTLPNDFEEVSLIALKNYLPNNATSHIFGTTSGEYSGKFEDKVKKLAKHLKYKVKAEATSFQKNDTGDGGLDLVAWLPFDEDENQNNMQIFLSQCATGKEWYSKQHETTKIPSHYIDFKSKINYVFFMPYDCRNTDRSFAEQDEIFSGLFFDRIRILSLLKNKIDSVLNLKSFNSIVNQAISYEEEIV
ncbi:hypothetical protein [uncultured Gammaproteobacteria bacterium]|nr:hypothetical protein [uncultured Gammaproteobacteria bacterium]CAC9599436.1 hypothetical protein [uncultured Gammaproteobacteria bacterium]CAC9652322.1 hypothetical protein [uncultured Gammaproteobacteria bacterium]